MWAAWVAAPSAFRGQRPEGRPPNAGAIWKCVSGGRRERSLWCPCVASARTAVSNKSGRNRSTLPESGPALAEIVPKVVGVGPNLAADLGPKLARSLGEFNDRNLATFRRILAKVLGFRPSLARSSPTFARSRFLSQHARGQKPMSSERNQVFVLDRAGSCGRGFETFPPISRSRRISL